MPVLQQRATVVTQTLYKPGPTQAVLPQQQQQEGNGIPIGAIVGGTLAGIVLTLVVTIGWKWWGWRLMQPVTKKPAHLRIPEKGVSRPSSVYSRYSARISADWKTKAVPALPSSPTKMQKCLLLATPTHHQGRYPPSHTLFAIQEEQQGGSTRCSTPHGKGPRAPSPVACADYGKSSLTFPKTGAPQQEQPRHVKYVSAVYDNYGSTHAPQETRTSMDRTSKASSSVYSIESMGQVHHLSYLQQQHPPAARY